MIVLLDDSRTPATVEEVRSLIEEAGFEPIDSTDIYNSKLYDRMGNAIRESVSFQQDDIHFDFFYFVDDSYAERVRGSFRSYIREHRYSIPNVEITEAVSNYIKYTLKANGVYSVNIRVGDTLVYAYCDEENVSIINRILLAIDYL